MINDFQNLHLRVDVDTGLRIGIAFNDEDSDSLLLVNSEEYLINDRSLAKSLIDALHHAV